MLLPKKMPNNNIKKIKEEIEYVKAKMRLFDILAYHLMTTTPIISDDKSIEEKGLYTSLTQ